MASTRLFYAGSDTSVVALFKQPTGVLLTVTHFQPTGPGEAHSVAITWDEFRRLVSDAMVLVSDHDGH